MIVPCWLSVLEVASTHRRKPTAIPIQTTTKLQVRTGLTSGHGGPPECLEVQSEQKMSGHPPETTGLLFPAKSTKISQTLFLGLLPLAPTGVPAAAHHPQPQKLGFICTCRDSSSWAPFGTVPRCFHGLVPSLSHLWLLAGGVLVWITQRQWTLSVWCWAAAVLKNTDCLPA